ncbi:unnamed protein product [Darwinula stevensoni]|uniref:CARD domain-containing protein n=1 Tax=Darwinula stevensoni TaxID=69355 RepID=A0A7R8XF80_9CRUS|nr:unnamed protein product [Darwinula stevensoni]CAG0890335.1 unnamed protein product [Darwinula stevensoni]
MPTMANRSEEEELLVDGRTVAQVIAENIEGLIFIDHNAVIASLLRKQVIDHVENGEIMDKSPMEKIRFLQEKLPLKGDTAFQKFLESLKERNHLKLARKMRRECMDSSNGNQDTTVRQKYSTLHTSNGNFKGGQRRLHESDDLPVNDGDAVTTPIAFMQLENEKKKLEASNKKMANGLAMEKIEKAQLAKDLKESKDKVEELLLELRTLEEKAEDIEDQLKKEQNAYREIERDKRAIEKELKESNDQVEELQRKLSHVLPMKKKAKDLEEQLKRVQNAYAELEQDTHMIEKELKEKIDQVDKLKRQLANVKETPAHSGARNQRSSFPPTRAETPSEDEVDSLQSQQTRARVLAWSDLLSFNLKNKLIVIHIYSHTSVKIWEVENMEGRIAEKMSHAIFLDADLDADWTRGFFWTDAQRKRSNYFLFD